MMAGDAQVIFVPMAIGIGLKQRENVTTFVSSSQNARLFSVIFGKP
jgi:hypothetical protein